MQPKNPTKKPTKVVKMKPPPQEEVSIQTFEQISFKTTTAGIVKETILSVKSQDWHRVPYAIAKLLTAEGIDCNVNTM